MRFKQVDINSRYVIFLLIIPVFTILSFSHLNSARGPYFYGNNLDPEYAYLFNSLLLSELKPPHHIDHPGTPLQLLGGLYIKIINITNNQDFIRKDIFNNSENYIFQLNILLLFLTITTIVLIGFISYIITENIWISVLLQASLFCSPYIYYELACLRPDHLLISITYLFLTVIIMTERFDIEKYLQKYIAAFSIITGLGLATKIVFFPLVIIPIIIIPQIKNKIRYILFTILSFSLLTLPAWPKFLKFFSWIGKLFIHSGNYGSGNTTIIDSTTYFKNLYSSLFENGIFSYTLVLSALFLISSLIILKDKKRLYKYFRFKVLSGLTLAQIFQCLIVSKHYSPHYLIPALMLTGVTLLYLGFNINYLTNININKIFLQSLQLGIFIYFFAFTAINISAMASFYYKIKLKTDSIIHSISNYPEYSKIHYYRCSSRMYALKFGDDFAGGKYGIILNTMFPNNYFYDIWDKNYYNFNNNLEIEQIIHNNPYILFQGTSFEKIYKNTNYKPNLKLKDIYLGHDETFYKLQPM